ncbi:Na+/H+ antiporter subunit G [Oceanobacillus chungangensis]|uniref:Na+/H+ antiporter subunit G n=1 Tax=Oceanobacillus chungangensis TaxID=1229152 RepID=A0A3D8PN23_9BACI|nr:Na+/H+ antiporter subunit G [Oceanobacillus chungangensis]RDW17374.1 Na+/H+ antiporter subunit G [Oceanobacillus chungangensis]
MNASTIAEFIAALLILIGAAMALISAIGIIRFPDIYTRSHAATKSSTLAVLLTLLGAFLYFVTTTGFISVRLLLGIIFVFITSPVAGHLITRAAYRAKVKLADSTIEDELADVLNEKERREGK